METPSVSSEAAKIRYQTTNEVKGLATSRSIFNGDGLATRLDC